MRVENGKPGEEVIMSVMIRDVGGVRGANEAFKTPGPEAACACCTILIVGTCRDMLSILSSRKPSPEQHKCHAGLEFPLDHQLPKGLLASLLSI